MLRNGFLTMIGKSSMFISYRNNSEKMLLDSYEYVRMVSLFNEKPFEHEFFLRIQKPFPFMESLSINNKNNHKIINSHMIIMKIYLLINVILLVNVVSPLFLMII